MRSSRLPLRAVLPCAAFLATSAGAVPRTFSGLISYDGLYSADTLYVAVVDTGAAGLFGYDAVAVGSPPFTQPYSVGFDDATAPGPLLVAAVLDVDDTGFDPDSLDDVVTDPDVLGWYAGQAAPTFVDPGTSRSDLDFALPTGEIEGFVAFAPGQTWADIEAMSVPDLWSPKTFVLFAEGPYSLIGLYAGDWIVHGEGPFGDVCHGDATCTSPTILSLATGQTLSGIDLDFAPTPVDRESWGRIKTLYR